MMSVDFLFSLKKSFKPDSGHCSVYVELSKMYLTITKIQQSK